MPPADPVETPVAAQDAPAAISPAPTPVPARVAAPVAPPWPEIRHTLRFPITPPGGEVVSEVVCREPDVEALERIDNLGMVEGQPLKVAQIRGIIAALSGLPDDVIRKMHKTDFAGLTEKVVPLLELSAGGGKPH